MPEDDQFSKDVARKIRNLEDRLSRLETVGRVSLIPGKTLTVGTGKMFTTVQGVSTFLMNNIPAYQVVVNVDPGDYNESVVCAFPLSYSVARFNGDTRYLAGCSFISGNGGNTVPIQVGYSATYAGSGNCTLSNSGSTITVVGSVSNPNFSLDNWVSGDRVYVLDNSGTWTLMTVQSTSGNVITFTTTAPTVGNIGTSIVMLPNRRIYSTGSSLLATTSTFWGGGGMSLYGFWLDRPISSGYPVQAGGMAGIFYKCVMSGGALGASLWGAGAIGVSASTIIRGPNGASNYVGIDARSGFGSYSRNTNVISADAVGILAWRGMSYLDVASSIVANSNIGFQSGSQSVVNASSSAAVNCGTGYYALENSLLQAGSVNTNGTVTPYNPAAASTEGNIYGIIER